VSDLTEEFDTMFLCICCFILLALPSVNALEWNIEAVGTEDSLGTYSSLELDGQGAPHISFWDWNNNDLMYAFKDGSTWFIEVVDSTGGGSISLELDDIGRPHISYTRGIYDELRYAFKNGSGWHIEALGEVYIGGWTTSLALDSKGLPHIVIAGPRYKYKDGSGWHTETVDGDDVLGLETSLTLDSMGFPHISYGDFSQDLNADLKYAFKDSTGWHALTVDDQYNVGAISSIALDGGDCPHISYLDMDWAALKYAYADNEGWHIETVDEEASAFWATSLALDVEGLPHISYDSYQDAGGYRLRYASKDGSGWQIETVDSQADAGGHSSLALDAARYPHISYYDRGYGMLKYAYAEPEISANIAQGARLPGGLHLISVRPNPAMTQTFIMYDVEAGTYDGGRNVSLEVYDFIGRLVAKPMTHKSSEGTHSFRWRFDDQRDIQLPPGVYVLRIRATNPDAHDAMKLVVVK
jgi:hypothetical protein